MNWLAGFFPGFGPEVVAAMLSGMATLLVLYAVWSSFIVRDPMASRAKTLMKYRRNLPGPSCGGL